MSTAPTYLLAKYAADVRRMEPRNIGVILWASAGVSCRFLPTAEAPFVDDGAMYERWTKFWSDACRKPELQTKKGQTVKKRNAEFLKALIETQSGNYFLYEAGFIADDVPASDRENAIDFLYRTLVAVPGADDDNPPRDSLEARCDALFEEVGLSEREEFKPNYPLELETEGIKTPFRFDYAWENGRLGALFLRVNLGVQPSTTNAAFLFEHAKIAPNARMAERYALVAADARPGGQLLAINDERLVARRQILSKLAHVIEVNDAAEFRSAVGRIAI